MNNSSITDAAKNIPTRNSHFVFIPFLDIKNIHFYNSFTGFIFVIGANLEEFIYVQKTLELCAGI